MLKSPLPGICLVFLALAGPSSAVITGPYTADTQTAHLFHFDESALQTVALNAASGGASGVAFDGDPALNHATDAQPVAGTILGAAGFTGFGKAANISTTDLGVGIDANASGGFQLGLTNGASPDAVSHGSLAGADGSFTVEALVNLASITGLNREIISTDNSLSASTDRGFQFRINTGGQLEFNFIGTGTGSSTIAIPTSGSPHAFAANQWFHAAVSFNGPAHTATFYWTRLSVSPGVANAIGTSTNETTSAAVSGPVVIGNEGRYASGEGFSGLIDEVRISRTARSSTEFLFAPTVVTLTTGDAIGASSFNQSGNWSDGNAPSAASHYSAGASLLRTPPDALDRTFSGLSLTIPAGGTLLHKGIGDRTYTIAPLKLDGGLIRAGTSHTQTMTHEGAIVVTGNGSTISADQCNLVVNAPISGTGGLVLSAGQEAMVHTITVNGANSTSGDLTVVSTNAASSVIFSATSEWSFTIGSDGVNNTITGTGNAFFNGTFKIPLSGASSAQGASWKLVDAASLGTVAFGSTFKIPGWIRNNGVWTDPSGVYQFFETSGGLIVIPTGGTDVDGDGLADAWEIAWFGTLSFGAADNPDGDADNNAVEFASGSVPVNSASDSADTDADGLPDAWETSWFNQLGWNAGDDSDGDGFGNLQEQQAATNPADPASRPPGAVVKLVPVDDGDPATSEFGYAGSSAINSVAFVRSSLQTFGNQQFMTWYGRHQFNAADDSNNKIWVGRRTVGSPRWEIFKHPTFTANTITDGHDVISFGIDGTGFMHLSWGMHGDAFHYAKSTTPVTGTGAITLGPDTTMTGTENQITYPQFLRLPDGDLLYLFREVASGNGDTYVNRYDTATGSWANVHGSGNSQNPFIKGTGWTPNYNAYLNMPQLGGPDGDDLILTWCWRFSSGASDNPGSTASGYQTNNRINFARSPDAGLTWRKFDGSSYTLPITRDGEAGAGSTAEVIRDIPENFSLINQASTCLDANDNPVTCTWWAPESAANYRRQYMVVFRDDNGTPETGDDSWQTRTVSDRASDPANIRYAENHVRDLGRPTVVCDDRDRVIVAYRDNQRDNTGNADSSLSIGEHNGITIVHSLPKSEDPHRLVWVQFDLTRDNLGNYETMIDNELWDSSRQLHFLYQASEGQGYTAPANLASRISVLEWDAARYFSHHPQPSISFNPAETEITITCPSEPSWAYRLWTSDNLIDWEIVETVAGTGAPLVFTRPAVSGESRRFWRVQYKEGGFESP